MCMSHKIRCECGKETAEFTMRDEVLAPEVIKKVNCPACASADGHDAHTMLADNGWVIHYDMEVAELFAARMKAAGKVTPEYIFDEGYCTWAGYCPGDLKQAAIEKEEIVKTMKADPRGYVKKLMDWGQGRARRLSDAGWRKARHAV